MPSATRPSHDSAETTGFRNRVVADAFTRAQWRSRSGVTPSNARAPSNTEEPSHAAWVRAPMIGTLPSCQSPSKKVQVLDGAGGRGIALLQAALRRKAPAFFISS